MRRTLALKKETLTDLTPAELGQVAGAALTPHCPTFEPGCRIPTDHCVSVTDCLSMAMDPCVSATYC